MGVNVVVINGRLGKDAKSSETKNGKTRIQFSIANSRRYKDANGERQEDTSWIFVSYYGAGAEAIQKYLVKGKEVTVVGRLSTYSFEKDGETRSGYEVIAQDVQLGAGGRDSNDNDDDDDDEEEAPRKSAPKKSSSKGSGNPPW